MKKITLIIIFACLASFINLFSQIDSTDSVRIRIAIEANPWTIQTGMLNNAIIYGQVKKDGILFQPSGVLLGVFKDGVCRGFGALQIGPVGNLHQFTYGSNEDTETGLNYLVYDPTDNKTYTVTETLSFTKDINLGRIIAPIQLNISGVSALISPEMEVVKICPNPIDDQFTLSLNRQDVGTASIRIFDTSGRTICNLTNIQLNENGKISIERNRNIKNGIYFLQLTIGDKSYFEKLIFN